MKYSLADDKDPFVGPTNADDFSSHGINLELSTPKVSNIYIIRNMYQFHFGVVQNLQCNQWYNVLSQ